MAKSEKPTIAFVLNTTGLTGGVKVIFKHAKMLSDKGYKVYIIHLTRLDKGLKGYVLGKAKILKTALKSLLGKEKVAWYDLGDIKIITTDDLKKIPDVDIIIATANETADQVNDFNRANVKKYYFIQDYENWTREKSKVDQTYRYPLKKIVISSWLKNIVEDKFKSKVEGIVINGVDFDRFDNPDKNFNKKIKILMLYHILSKKGIKYGFEAFKLAQKKFPEIELVLFGAYQPIEEFPKDTTFHFNPSPDLLEKLYASSDIFISPSLQEGCQLPPMEAMAAQCAVISTNVGGIPDYAISGKTAIVIPPGDSEALGKAVISLISDPKKLREVARQGYKHIQNFTWEKSNDKLEEILTA